MTQPPPVMAKPLPALSAPANAKPISPQQKVLILEAGDYSAELVHVSTIVIPKTGRVRLFIKVSAASLNSNAFECCDGSRINAVDEKNKSAQCGHLEIWYDGKAPIRLGKLSQFNGLIYAPNSQINLDRGAVFHGAMVAKRVTAAGDCKIMYDQRYAHLSDDFCSF